MSTTTSQTSGWRALNADELAATPHAKLGGALAVMFWGAVAMVAALTLMLAAMIAFGNFFSITMLSRTLFSTSTLSSKIASIQMIPQAMFAVWAFTFAVMTMGRRPSTPTVASVLMVLWAVTAISAQIGTRYLVAQSNFDVLSQLSLLPYIFLEIVLVAAFCGYMADGHRPNVYFLKRVRA